MAFFSWFKPKTENVQGDESEADSSSTPATEPKTSETEGTSPPQQGIPRFRETVPQSARPVSGSAPPKRALRDTIDIPLQTLSESLPQGMAQDNPSLDPKRRIQIPRKEVRVNDTDHTGTVSLYVVHAVCPEIFASPVPATDNRSVTFPLPAWERLRNAEVLEGNTGPFPVSESVTPEPDHPTIEEPDLTAGAPKDELHQHMPHEGERVSDKHQPPPSTTNDKTQPPEAFSIRANRRQNLRIALSPILRQLPAELNRPALHNLAGSNLEIELPFELIQQQLSGGRVTVPLSVFLEGLPETVRKALAEADQSIEVPIPLKEIFRHLPGDALPLRADQELDEIRGPIETPFTTTVREDAEKFRNGVNAVEKSEEKAAQLESDGSAESDRIEALPDTPEPNRTVAAAKAEPDFSSLQMLFLTDERLDLHTIVDKISAFPGLRTALLHTADGRRIAGSIADEQFERAALSLFPALFDEVKSKLDERECAGLETLTLCWRQEQISVFSTGQLCLSVRHSCRPFKPGVREKLSLIFSRLAEALSSSEF